MCQGILTQHGKPVATIVIIARKDRIDRVRLAQAPRFQKLLTQADKDISRSGAFR